MTAVLVIGGVLLAIGIALVVWRTRIAAWSLRTNKRLGIGWDNNDYPARKDEPYFLYPGLAFAVIGLALIVVALLAM
jgi:hypothetical protein